MTAMVRLFLTAIFLLAAVSCDAALPAPLPAPTASPTQPAAVTASAPTPTQEPPPAAPTVFPSPSPPTATPTLFPADTALPPSPTADLQPTRSRYQIAAEIDYAGHTAAVSQTLTYVNTTDGPLSEILLLVEPNRAAGAFTLLELNWDDGSPVDEFTLHTERLRIALPGPLLPGHSATLSLVYNLAIPELDGPLGYNDRQTNLGDWYPYVPPYQNGWIVHQPAHVGEHLAYDIADFDVRIALAPYDQELVIAAAAPAFRDGRWRRYALPGARSFALSLSDEYEVASTIANGVSISTYYFPESRSAGIAASQAAAAAIRLYSQTFAPYPHRTFSVVQALFDDGMEYDGLVFLDHDLFDRYAGDPAGYLTAITAHETAHQWWYGLVANDQAVEPWLDEALATYSELLFFEAVHPAGINWWWETRVQRFRPSGNVGSTIYDHQEYRTYVDSVYLRGALLVDDIRRALGDEAFTRFLRDYLSRHPDRLLTAGDFWSTLDEYGLEDADALRDRYFVGP